MAFLDWFSSQGLPEHWNSLTSAEDVQRAIQRSDKEPIAFFKHSTRCGTSHHIMDQLLEATQNMPLDIPFYYLDLIAHRDLSRMIAEELEVVHQSPQLILVFRGKVISHASHHAIDWAKMTAKISSISPL
jgi:bacillithiol system protein YtxJ